MRIDPATPFVKNPTPQKLALCAGLMLLASSTVSGQEFTAADSGWVRLFNGVNFDGFYSRTYNVGGTNAPLVTPPGSPYTIEYAGTDTATIRVGTTANQGNIGTLDTTFSHYRLRWESKYDAVNNNSNSGMTYHVDESAIRMHNNWPRSIEFQGKQNEIGSAFSIQQVTFSTRVSSSGQGGNYVATGGTVVNACEYGCNGRWYRGNPAIRVYDAATPNVPRWLRFHLVVRGADSAIHIVNDTTVFRLWNMRIFNDATRTTGSSNSGSASRSNMTPDQPWDHGGLGWQAEGATVRYRRLEVMRMPPSTPMSAHYLHRLLLGGSSLGPVYPDSTLRVTWRSIGTVPQIKLEYRYTSPEVGDWVTITESAPNTGSHDWVIPREPQGLPKAASVVYGAELRISSPLDYVQADTARFDVVWSGTNVQPGLLQGVLTFGLPDGRRVLANLSVGTRVEIHDLSGSRVRVLKLGEGSVVWDRRDAQGRLVRPGIYFARAVNGGTQYRTARMLVH